MQRQSARVNNTHMNQEANFGLIINAEDGLELLGNADLHHHDSISL